MKRFQSKRLKPLLRRRILSFFIYDPLRSRNSYWVKEYQNKSNADNEMAYDANGNLVKDLDRDIMTIRYNILNLPEVIQFKNGNQITNLYDAGGRKLQTTYITFLPGATAPVVNAGDVLSMNYSFSTISVNIKHYIGNFEYDHFATNNPRLSRIYNAEGYVQNVTSPQYFYYRKDHLGDNREVWCANTDTTVQRTQYYPSGLPWAESTGASVQNRKYNGKEFIEMHGYDTCDYGARGYYPAIMRFGAVDPLAEKRPWMSPYVYCSDNPLNRIDPDGKLDLPSMKDIKTTLTAVVTAASIKVEKVVKQSCDEAKETIVAAAKSTQNWVKENKTEILRVAQAAQKTGDTMGKAGLIVAGVGVVSGVGAAGGLGLAAFGSGVGLASKVLEVVTNVVASGDIKESSAALPSIAGAVAGTVAEKLLPGSGSATAVETKELIKATNSTFSSTTDEIISSKVENMNK